MSEEDYRKIFAENLNYYMDKFNKSQSDLATDLNYSSSIVSAWCSGSKIPRIDKIQSLAEYFKIEVTDLLRKRGDNKKSYYLDERTKEIAQAIYDSRELSLLFDAAKGVESDDLMTVYRLLSSLKKKEGE